MRPSVKLCLLAITLALVALQGARSLLESGWEEAVENAPNYLAHRPPPTGGPLPKRLDKLLDTSVRQVNQVPRVFLSRLPASLPDLENATIRKRAFISAMLPIILRANELTRADRTQIIALGRVLASGERLSGAERRWISKLARRYRVPVEGSTLPQTMTALLRRVDTIPPSLAIAQAAIESGWGTSYFSQEGNALFGEWTYGDGQGITPRAREEGKSHRIKSFDYLLDSVRSYMTNLNRNPAYRELREIRSALRRSGKPVTGPALAVSLVRYSERGAPYVDDVLGIIEYNRLDALDGAQLSTEFSR